MEIVDMKNAILDAGWTAEGIETKKVWGHPDYNNRFTIKGAYDLMMLGSPVKSKGKMINTKYEDKAVGAEKDEKKKKTIK